jgi:hypothetical protein
MAAPVIPAITSGYADFLQPKWHRVLVEVGSEIEDLWRWIFNHDPDMAWSPMQESQISGLGSLVSKPQGQGFSLDSIIEGGSTTYTSNPWGLGFEWTIEMMRFDLYGIFDDIAADLVRAAPHRVELEAWSLVNDQFDGSLFTGFDGLSLVNTAHPFLDAQLGTFSNRSATNIALSQAGIQEGLLFYNTLRDMRGLPNRRRPALVLIKPDRIPAAREVLQSEFDPKSSNNAVNTIVDDQLKYFASRYLTSVSAWSMIARPMAGNRGHDIWVRMAIPPLPDQFEDRRTKSSVQTMYENFAVGFGSAFGWWASAGNGA